VVKKEKNTEKVIRDLVKSNIAFFLLREQDENNEIIRVFEDSIKSLKDDIKSLEDKKNEYNRLLSVKKDMLDRNYISAKLKKNNDSINNKKSQLKDKEEQLKKTKEDMSKKEIEKKEEVSLEEKFIPKKAAKVVFDKSTGKPWEVMFTDRGFEIGDTRLSFENIEEAINKNFNIILDAGNGLVLDQNKLNKIMKYKGRF
jgi:DNA repair exonuclease SbcCD ATPase subunit